jgi:toxin ParE1/3/4
MTELPIVRRARAEEDLIEIWSYVATFSESAADRLLDRFQRHWELLATQPYSGAAREDIAPGLRHVVVGEYLTLYRVTEEAVVIVRVIHGRRNLSAQEYD